jgi:hypothetical protein
MGKAENIIKLKLVPVGLKILGDDDIKDFEDVAEFSGVSFCGSFFGAAYGMELIVKPGSVKVCQWTPVVLGFKQPENSFERCITEHLQPVTPGIYVAPMHVFRKGVIPDAVVIRTTPDNLAGIIDVLGWENFISPDRYGLDYTALDTFRGKGPKGVSALSIKYFNALLSRLGKYAFWNRVIAYIFKSTLITNIFNRLITKYMANMSICRNSFVLPYLTGKANISYFCTGGIAWGNNDPENLTSGYPYEMFARLYDHLDYPGKIDDDPRLLDLIKIRKNPLAKVSAKGCMTRLEDRRGEML